MQVSHLDTQYNEIKQQHTKKAFQHEQWREQIIATKEEQSPPSSALHMRVLWTFWKHLKQTLDTGTF